MSRGRPRHQGSRRRAYSARQREVRERRLRLAHDEADWAIEGLTAIEDDARTEAAQPAWTVRLQSRATAA